MEPSNNRPLRIYCVCGQKMRVSEDMFGRPGKCVACRQRLTVPRREEIPEGAEELSLREHPQFLRSTIQIRRSREEREYKPLPAEQLEIVPVAPDVLPPLRTLASLQHRLQAKIKDAREASEDAGELESRLERIREARDALDDSLRELLRATLDDRDALKQRLETLRKKAMDKAEGAEGYLAQADEIRRIRDNLERRVRDLKGWLAVEDPVLAGGYERLPLDHEPPSIETISFPHEMPPEKGRLDWWRRQLERASERHKKAAQARADLAALRKDGRKSRDMDRRIAEAESEADRMRARMELARDRLQVLEADLHEDIEVVDAQEAANQHQLEEDRVTREEFAGRAKALEELREFLLSARKRAAEAQGAAPQSGREGEGRPEGAALARKQPPSAEDEASRRPFDALLLTGAAAAFFVALFLPLSGGRMLLTLMLSPEEAPAAALWAVAVGAALALAGAFVRDPRRRGTAAVIATFFTALGAAMFHYEFSRVPPPARGLPLETGAAWLSPSGIAVLLGIVLSAAAAAFSMKGRWKALTAAGANDPQPQVRVAVENPGLQTQYARVNGETGHIVLERRNRGGAWRAAPPTVFEDEGAPVRVAPGQTVDLIYALTPGEWRVRQGEEVLAEHAVAPGPAPSGPPEEAAPEPLPPTEPPAAGSDQGPAAPSEESVPVDDVPAPAEEPAIETTGEDAQPAEAPEAPLPQDAEPANQIEVQWRGTLAAQGQPAAFALDVYLPDGSKRERRVSFGDTVYRHWYIEEYNSALETLTLSNGEDIYIIPKGERVTVNVPAPPMPEAEDAPNS
jgi:hypothetical protein